MYIQLPLTAPLPDIPIRLPDGPVSRPAGENFGKLRLDFLGKGSTTDVVVTHTRLLARLGWNPGLWVVRAPA